MGDLWKPTLGVTFKWPFVMNMQWYDKYGYTIFLPKQFNNTFTVLQSPFSYRITSMQPVMGFPHKLMVHVNYTPIGPSPIRLLLQTHGTCQLYPHWAIPFRLLLQTHGTCQLYPHWATPLQAIITTYMSHTCRKSLKISKG